MTPEDLELAVERHATSKLPDGDLVRASTPSAFAARRCRRSARWRGSPSPPAPPTRRAGSVDRGRGGRERRRCGPRPRRRARGSRSRDLFAATPARLKFLKSDRAEAQAVAEIVKRLAMAHPHDPLHAGGRPPAPPSTYPPEQDGEHGFLRRARARARRRVPRQRHAASTSSARACALTGFAGLPTYHRGTSSHDPFLRQRPPGARQAAARRGARRLRRRDGRDRHPVLALFIELRPARRSTSTCIRPRPRCASAIRRSCAASSSAR